MSTESIYTEKLQVGFSPEQKEVLRRQARKRGLTMAAYIREVVWQVELSARTPPDGTDDKENV